MGDPRVIRVGRDFLNASFTARPDSRPPVDACEGATTMATTAKQLAMTQMIGLMERFEWDMGHAATREGRVPREWREVWQTRSSKKRKVSLYLDEDAYRLFKSMGPGMGPRMNRVLSAFARARVAGLLEGEDLMTEYRERWMGKPKPQVAEAMARLSGLRGEGG